MAEKVQRTLFAVTANNLVDGRVRYLGSDRIWVCDFAAAFLIEDPAQRDELVAWGRSQTEEVTGCYGIDIGITESGEKTMSARERLRADGEAAVRQRIGYQA